MPIWLMATIITLTLGVSFGCPKCQTWREPRIENPIKIENIKKIIRDTPVVVYSNPESLTVFFIPTAHKHFQRLYDDVVRCSGLKADSLWDNDIDFYVSEEFVMHIRIKMPDGSSMPVDADGFYDWNSHEIVMSLNAIGDDKAVAHEILHAILNYNNVVASLADDQHPDKYFGNHDGKCRGIVRPH